VVGELRAALALVADCGRMTGNPSLTHKRRLADEPDGARKQPVVGRCVPQKLRRGVSGQAGSDLGHAAIDDQFDAGDIATFVRSEK
jgi:hypothetical protein